MIAYDLKCRDHGHRFEGWFASLDAFYEQQAKGWLACPQCGSTAVEKMLSAPYVAAKSNQDRPPSAPVVQAEAPPTSPAMASPAPMPPVVREMLARVAEAQVEALKTSEWVGDSFANEVRAQHYGETETRPVHGQATPQQAQDLNEEGIAIMPILFPIAPPDKRN